MRNNQHHGNPREGNRDHRYNAPTNGQRLGNNDRDNARGSASGNWGSSDSDGQFDAGGNGSAGRGQGSSLPQEGMSRSDHELQPGNSKDRSSQGADAGQYGTGRTTSQPGSDRWSGQHAGKGPKGYQRSDDRIKEEVSEELSQHGGIDASEVEVAVKDGEVTLSGTVAERQMKRMAEDCVENCSGIKHVQNNIRVSKKAQEA